ncbi:hypothetical protein V8G54_001465 [Vigna mungo]|uniref:Fe2OG dioxygenase domain-containing protein n=1 Tax=Vigna mungo TaxID=3915 RepID=A0AAQ3SBI9_VIGMU
MLVKRLEAKRFEEFFMKDQTSFLRLNHYPPCPNPHLALGVGRHKDPGALTILSQDEVEGLEVKHKAHEEWIRIKPIPNAYIINLETEVKPLEELINDQNPSKYRTYKWGKFLVHRINTNFKKHKVGNIQIHDFKTR